MAFEKWQAEAAAMVHERRVVGGAVQRLVQRQVSRAFEQWQGVTERMLEERRLLQQAATRLAQTAARRRDA